jgi:O-methyltransferase involved in polyketide biosynthesis
MTASAGQPVSMELKGVQETTLLPLAAKARDAEQAEPVLGDKYSAQTLSRIDPNYDWQRATGNPLMQSVMVSRARLLDDWTAEFLRGHAEATVIHIASGLDSRCLRLAPIWTAAGKKVRWIDVDLPDVVELRRKLELPEPEGGDYELRAADALAQDWLDAIPADRPTVVVAEGLVMYLKPEDGLSLFERLAKRFQGVGGQIVCDLAGSWIVGTQKQSPTSRMAELQWAVDNPETVAETLRGKGCRGFQVAKVIRTEDMSENYSSRIPLYIRIIVWFISWLPWRMMLYTKFVFQRGERM